MGRGWNRGPPGCGFFARGDPVLRDQSLIVSETRPPRDPGRHPPAHGVRIALGEPNLVFLTICTHGRRPWLTQPAARADLEAVWREADTWLVGHYMLMPDHLHLFCAPHDLRFTLERWVSYWKSRFRRRHLTEPWEWQRDFWDTRLRREESYEAKWRYVQENPVRAGLVTRPEDWPHQGTLNVLRW